MTDESTDLPQVATIMRGGYKVVINRGSEHGVREGRRYVVFGLSHDDVLDPKTGEPLGKLEIVRGEGVVESVQPKMATLRSLRMSGGKTTVVLKTLPTIFGGTTLFGAEKTEERTIEPPSEEPFENPQVGDYARRVPG